MSVNLAESCRDAWRRSLKLLVLGLAAALSVFAVDGCTKQVQRTSWTYTAQGFKFNPMDFGPDLQGAPIYGYGTYAVSDIGQPDVPRLTRTQIRWVNKIKTSRAYHNRQRFLRFTMVRSRTPLLVYDACENAFECGDKNPDGSLVYLGETFHVIGECDEVWAPRPHDPDRADGGMCANPDLRPFETRVITRKQFKISRF